MTDNDKKGIFIYQPGKRGYQPTDGQLDTSKPPGSSSDQSSSNSGDSNSGGGSESSADDSGSTDKDS